MYRTLLIFLLFSFISFSQAGPARAEDMITLRLPQQVITRAVEAVLPYKIDNISKSVSGNITIVRISDIELDDGMLTCHLHLKGENLAVKTEIAGHKIRLNVGSTEIDFTTDAEVRFDNRQQTLFIKPVVRNLTSGQAGPQADIGQAVVALFNGQEFPVKMQELEPLLADTGTKVIEINSRIAYIAAIPQAIQIGLTPVITSRKMTKK
jgi:hypothetical protein